MMGVDWPAGRSSVRKCLCKQRVYWTHRANWPKDFPFLPYEKPWLLHGRVYFHATREETEACALLYGIAKGART